MQNASLLVFAVVVALFAWFAPQVGAVLLLAMIYVKMDRLAKT
jgi:hypothetical protein